MSAKEETKANSDGTIPVNLEEFSRTRDSVLVSLAQLQSAVSDLSRAYLNHTNTVLGRGSSNLDLSHLTNNITNTLYESGLLGDAGPGGDKKKRKRAPPDPNAPKRALTPFFLFMQHNRRRIAEELDTTAKPKEVADEGTRRWSNLPESQKEVWRKLYADNLANYREKMKAYKAGLPVPDDDNAQAANQLQQGVAGAEASEGESEQSSEEGESDEEESPSPAKEPTPPRSGKRRRSDLKVAKEPVAATPNKKDDDKKKRPARKGKEEETASARKDTGADSKRTKKKRKSEVGEE